MLCVTCVRNGEFPYNCEFHFMQHASFSSSKEKLEVHMHTAYNMVLYN